MSDATPRPASDELPPTDRRQSARDAIEVNKTAIVWLVVVNVLTVLTLLLPLPFKWWVAALGALALASLGLAYLAYSRANHAARSLSD